MMFETLEGVNRLAEEADDKLGEALAVKTQAQDSFVIEKIGADILSIIQELRGVKHELSMTSDAKNRSKIEEIHAKMELISITFRDLSVEVKSNETIELVERLKNELKALKGEKENSKKVVERLTLVMYDTSSEARRAKENLLSTQAQLKNVKNQIENLELCMKDMKKKLQEEIWKVSNPSNPIVFLDISIAGAPAGRIIIELFADVTPLAAENFRALCTGEKGIGRMGAPLHYKGYSLDQVAKGDFSQGGCIPSGNRSGGESIYDPLRPVDNYTGKHTVGALSIASKITIGSEFFICHTKIQKYDGNYCVFGHIIDGMDVLKAIDEVGSYSWKPTRAVKIVNCGQLC